MWQASQVLPMTANIEVCFAEVMVVPLKAVNTAFEWQSSQGVVLVGMCTGDRPEAAFGVKALAARLASKFNLPWSFLDHPTGL